MSDNEQQYFATKPTREAGKEVWAKVEEYYRDLDSSGYFNLVRKSYFNYYGSSTENTSTGRLFRSADITRGGKKGETYDIKINDFRNLLQHMLVMTTSERQAQETMAVNTDYESLVQAELGDGLLEYYQNQGSQEEKQVQAVETCLWGGGGYVTCTWDTEAGREFGQDPETGVVKFEGDVAFNNYTCMDIIQDPNRNDVKSHWKIVKRYENRWDLMALYPELVDKIRGIESKDEELDKYSFSSRNGSGDKSDEIAVFDFYHEKRPSVPQGRMITILPGGDVIFDGPLPYPEIPVYTVQPARIEGCPYGFTPAFDMLSIQEACDILNSSALTNLAAFGTQLIWVPKGSDINRKDLGTGLAVISSDGTLGKPEPLNLATVPPELFRLLDYYDAKMEKMVGMNSVARGNPEGQLSGASGAAMALLASRAIEFNSGLQRQYERLVEKTGTATIKTLQKYATTSRVAYIVGKSKRGYMKEFNGKNIDKLDRVVVKRTSAVSRTTAGKTEIANALLNQGMLTNPHQYIELISSGNLDTMIEAPLSELANLKSENERLREGEFVQAVLTDTHVLHIQEHKTIFDNPEVRGNPEFMQNALAHIQEHIALLQNTDPNLLQLLGQQPLAPQGALSPAGGGEAPAGAPSDMPMDTSAQQVADQMPSGPGFPTNPVTGEEFQPSSPEAQNVGQI